MTKKKKLPIFNTIKEESKANQEKEEDNWRKKWDFPNPKNDNKGIYEKFSSLLIFQHNKS